MHVYHALRACFNRYKAVLFYKPFLLPIFSYILQATQYKTLLLISHLRKMI